jgi:hypothetical protein
MRGADALLGHLRHAEEWLIRARRDHRRGDHRAAVLRLMLAEAEIRRARETEMQLVADPPARPVRPFPMAVGVLGAAVVLVVIGYAALLGSGVTAPANAPAVQSPDAAAPAPGNVIQLDAGGALTLPLFAPRETWVGGAARAFGDRVIDDVALDSRLTPAFGASVTLLSPLDAERPAGTL